MTKHWTLTQLPGKFKAQASREGQEGTPILLQRRPFDLLNIDDCRHGLATQGLVSYMKNTQKRQPNATKIVGTRKLHSLHNTWLHLE